MGKLMRLARALILLSALLLPVHGVAQDVGTSPVPDPVAESGRAAQYFLGDRNAIYITINVWGKVNKPGQYNIPSGTNLLTLLSAAGGPSSYSRLDNVRIVRLANQREEILEIDVRRYLKTGDFSLIPELKPGDTVVVSGSSYNWISNAVDVIAKVGILLNAVVLMQRLD
ncbi:MAG: SLBB domain-containing protein [bacterium]|nr:SLBB domain-containing protein [bacterium]